MQHGHHSRCRQVLTGQLRFKKPASALNNPSGCSHVLLSGPGMDAMDQVISQGICPAFDHMRSEQTHSLLPELPLMTQTWDHRSLFRAPKPR